MYRKLISLVLAGVIVLPNSIETLAMENYKLIEENNEVEENEEIIEIKDINLKKVINYNLGKGYIDSNIKKSELESLEELDLRNANIIKLDGLEHCSKLRILDLSANSITDIELLSKLENLEVLYLNDNKINYIEPLGSLKKLENLSLSGNEIDDEDVVTISKFTNLKILNISNNDISNINHLSEIINLKSLYISDTKVEDINVVSNLKELSYFNASRCKITDIRPLLNLKNVHYDVTLQRIELDHIYIENGKASIELPKIYGFSGEELEISDVRASVESDGYEIIDNTILFNNISRGGKVYIDFTTSYRDKCYDVYFTIPIKFKETNIKINSVDIAQKEIYSDDSTDISISIENSDNIDRIELHYWGGEGELQKNKENGKFEGKVQSYTHVAEHTMTLNGMLLYEENSNTPKISIDEWNYSDYGTNIKDFDIKVKSYIKDVQVSKDKFIPGDVATVSVDMSDYKKEIKSIQLYYIEPGGSTFSPKVIDMKHISNGIYEGQYNISTLTSPGICDLVSVLVTNKDGSEYIVNHLSGDIHIENDIRLHVVYPLEIFVDKNNINSESQVSITAKKVNKGIDRVSLVYQSTTNGIEYPVELNYNENTGNYEGSLKVDSNEKQDLLAIKKVTLIDNNNVEKIIHNRDLVSSIGVLTKDFRTADIAIGGYNNNRPVINVENKVLNVGDKFNVLEGVTATDEEDGNITNSIEVVENTVNRLKSGTYTVIYKVTDSQGATTTKTITVTVKGKEVSTPIGGGSSVILPQVNKVEFNDINNHWSENTIENFVKNGYIDGYGDNSFRPDNNMTRAEFVKVVNKVFGYTQKGEEQFTDVNKNDWFYDNICIGIKAGYIKGKSKEIFAPNDNITREEVAMILTNIMNNKDENLDKLNTFKDGDKTSQWAQSSVEGAIESGYINGYKDQTIRSNGNITRAEAVSMLSRVKKEEVSSILEDVDGYRSTRTQQIFTSFKINESLNLAPFSKDNVRIIYLNENGDAIAGLTKDKTWGGFLNNNNTKFPKGLENNSEYSNNLQPGIYTSTTKASDTDKYKDVKSVKVVVVKDGVEYSSKFEI